MKTQNKNGRGDAVAQILNALNDLLNVLSEQGNELSDSGIAYLPEWNKAKEVLEKYKK